MKTNSKKIVNTILKLVITSLILIFIYLKFDVDFLDAFSKCSPIYLFFACMLRIFISPLIYINRWRAFLRYAGINEKFFSLLKISMKAAFIGIVLPSSQGADIMRMVMIEKKHNTTSLRYTASTTVLMERIIGFVLLAMMGLVFSLLVDFPNKYHVVMLILLINLALWLAIVILTNNKLFSIFSSLLSRCSKFQKLSDFFVKTYNSFVNYPYRKILLPTVTLILLLQIVTVIIVYLVFLAFGVNLPFTQHLAFYPIIAILSIIPISISGLGIREGFFVYFYSLVGVSAEISMSVSLVNYFIEIVLMAILGSGVYLYDSIKSMR